MLTRVKLNRLEVMPALPYLRRTVTCNNSDWVVIYSNLHKAHRRWGMSTKGLGKTGALIKPQAMIYKEAVQEVLLYERKYGWW